MHILVITQQYWPEKGVPQRRLQWLFSYLSQHGDTFSVVTSPPHYPSGTLLDDSPQYSSHSITQGKLGETIYRTSFREHSYSINSRVIDQGTQMLSALGAINRAIKDHRPDLILATAPPIPTIINAWQASRQHKIPYVIDLRDAWPDNSPYIAYRTPTQQNFFRILARQTGALFLRELAPLYVGAIKASDGLITTTFSHAEELNARWGLRCHTMRNLANLSSANTALEDDTSPTGKQNTPEHDKRPLEIAYMGTIGRAQGLHILLDTAQELQKRHIPVHILLHGQGTHAAYLKEESKKRNLPIDVLPPIPSDEVTNVYNQADTILVPLEKWSPLKMTVPSKLFEIIGTGKHITAIAQGETAQIVQTSGTGDVIPPDNPQALANLWEKLYKTSGALDVSDNGKKWLAQNVNPKYELEKTREFLYATVT